VGFDPAGAILQVRADVLPGLVLPAEARIGRDEAVAIAGAALGASFADRAGDARLAVVRGGRGRPGAHLAWEVRGFLSEPLGDWHIFVEARDGGLVRAVDLLKRAATPCAACNPSGNPRCGRVFHENPVDALDAPSLRDLDNVDGAQHGCRLENLTSSSYLDGLYANTGLTVGRATPPFNYLRSLSQRAADEVNVYYHLDRAHGYLAQIGFPSVMAFSISSDAHDPALGDNSHYVPSGRYLEFGEGGVDDAQDPDVVYHEYGHAIQDDQVPGFGTTEEGGAIGEGFADYWAAAMTDDSLVPAIGPACVGSWDATSYNPYTGAAGSGCLRRVDGMKLYPAARVFEPHADGEIWSAALWSVRELLGGPLTDALVIKSHTFLTPTAGFLESADALLTADQALHGGVHAQALHAVLSSRGVPRSGLEAPPAESWGMVPFSCETGHPYANFEYRECRFTQPGASRVRFRFSFFETEPGFDEVLVSDGAYLQVQRLSGLPFGAGPGASAAVNGDTIVARFRADDAVALHGFRIEAVEFDAPAGRVPATSAEGIPLRIVRSGQQAIRLTWGPSCAPSDGDYAVYEGSLADFASHAPRACSTGGALTWTLEPSGGGRYYLVVPRNAAAEGSYGRTSSGMERPPAVVPCLPRSILQVCP